jgi:hypothetical protein
VVNAGETGFPPSPLPLTHVGGLLGVLATEMHFEFLAGVYVGDTVTCTLTFAERDEHRRRLTGEASYKGRECSLRLGLPG